VDTIQNTAPWQRSLPKDGFTDSWLTKETARKDARRREIGDRRSGLRVRIEPSGRATWVYYERIPLPGGEKPIRKKHALGTWPQVTIAAARDRVELIKRCKGGTAAVANLHATSPFADVVEWFIAGALSHRKLEREARDRGAKGQAEQTIRRLILPRLGKRPAALIRTGEIAALVESVARENGPTQAHKVLALTSQIFRAAASKEVVTSNPCDAVNPRDVGALPGEERPRCLAISRHAPGADANGNKIEVDEMAPFWRALASPDAPMTEVASLVARLLLLTGVRKGELLKAKWHNVHLEDEPRWYIPAADRKNGKGHEVPLSPLAVSLFKRLKYLAGPYEYVAASWRGVSIYRRARPLGGHTLDHAFQALFAERPGKEPYLTLPGGPVVPHDMRRSAKLLAQRCDAKANWAEQELWILGHAPPGKVAAHYDIPPDPVRFREIMESMSRLVLELVNPSEKVVRLDARRG
jgi:integrase